MSKGSGRDLNFELNVIPMIDILSVCICFLLMTVVWVQVGALKASQSMGGQAQAEQKQKPAVWLSALQNGAVKVEVKNVAKSKAFNQVVAVNDDGRALKALLTQLKRLVPELDSGIVLPSQLTAYSDIVLVMAQLQQAGIKNVGISPL